MEFTVETTDRVDVVDVTERVAAEIPEGTEGVATVFVRHTTAGVTINEAERRLLGDLEDALADLVPADGGWSHDEIDDNADAHLRAMLVGTSESVPVHDGDPALGTWQSVLLLEGDGPRTRTVEVAVTG